VQVEPVEVDQWTLQQRSYAPLYKASVADERGTVLYVSGLTGEVVQDTRRSERFWNWLGAVPHWLYFTVLRQDGALWSQVVIWTSLLGTFLTLTGVYVGIRMYGRGRRKSPFRGIALWHHWAGLIFGLVTLTWVFSGFASMQPWGWLESQGPGEELQAMAGRPMAGADPGRSSPRSPRIRSLEWSRPRRRCRAASFRDPRAADGSRDRAGCPILAPRRSTTRPRALCARGRPGAPIAAQAPHWPKARPTT
jgi:hypothetical protein